jgi:hypothetical protein
MVSWWPGDGNAEDIQGGHNGVLMNGATFASGEVDQAFQFNGGSERVFIADSPSLAITVSLTLDAWVNATSTPPNGIGDIIFRGDDRPFLDPYTLRMVGSNVDFQISDAAGNVASVQAPLPLNQFVHVAGTLDDATGLMTVYINGIFAAQTTTSIRPYGSLTGANPGVSIGNLQSDTALEPFVGLIDEVEVFNRALDWSEVLAIYNAGSSGKCKCAPLPPNLLSWWPGDGNANDIQGGKNGTLMNGATFALGFVQQAFSFDGIDAFVATPQVSPGSQLTLDAWLNPSTVAGGFPDPGLGGMLRRTAAGGGLNCHDWTIGLYGGKIGALYRPNNPNPNCGLGQPNVTAVLQSTENAQVGTWYHVALTLDGTTARLYVNGVLEATGMTDPSYTGDPGFQIGSSACCAGMGDAFAGLVDEVQVFNRVLSQNEIEAIVNAGSSGNCQP